MRALIRNIIIIFTGLIFLGTNVQAGEAENIAMLEQLLRGKPAEALQFSAQFLEAVPIEQLNAVLAELSQNIGKPAQIIPVGDEYEVTTASHVMSALISVDEKGRVAGLFFRPPVPLNAQLEDLLAPLTEVASDTSYLIIKDGVVLAQKDADQEMAIGSAFKLAILKVLQDDIALQNRQWDDIATLMPDLRSLPSGILQDYPDNAPFTLHTLASLMISQSDNTATDILLGLVGREKGSTYLDGQFVLSPR
jgi:beta-lactamase class A